MIDYDRDTAHSIALVRPQARLDKEDDLVNLAKTVDPQIEATGHLAGLIIDAPSFPGWENFGSMVSHLRFVREHQQHVTSRLWIRGQFGSPEHNRASNSVDDWSQRKLFARPIAVLAASAYVDAPQEHRPIDS